jgi:hypothetical protein
MDVTPLIFAGGLGFVASVLTRRAAVRFIAWLLIPLIIAILTIGPANFSLRGGEASMVWLGFARLFMLGLVASGAGVLIGYFSRKAFAEKT